MTKRDTAVCPDCKEGLCGWSLKDHMGLFCMFGRGFGSTEAMTQTREYERRVKEQRRIKLKGDE